jgi:heme O synthase-like polyprenyltransferase
MIPQDQLALLAIVARLIGGWYVFAGAVALNAWRMNVFMDRALEKLTLRPTDRIETLRGWTIFGVGALTLMSGVFLILLSPLAPPAFLACCALQGAYFAWARKALPPKDEAGKRGRRASTNAFLFYLGATAFVLGCDLVGLFR